MRGPDDHSACAVGQQSAVHDVGQLHRAFPDPLLSDLGEHQAQLLADAFAAEQLPRPDVIVSSLMARAVQTADIVASTLDLPIQGRLDAYEIGGPYEGDGLLTDMSGSNRQPYHGAPREDLQTLSPRLVLPDGAGEKGWYYDQLEDPADAPDRARQLLADLKAAYADQVVALVCHQEFGQVLFASLLGLPDDAPITFQLDNTSTSMFRVTDEVTHVAWLNDTDHLEPGEVTN